MAEGRLRCQRIGCDAFFTDEDNPDGSCRYHPSIWLVICRGCQTGQHTTEKPVLAKPATKPVNPVRPASAVSYKQLILERRLSSLQAGILLLGPWKEFPLLKPRLSKSRIVTFHDWHWNWQERKGQHQQPFEYKAGPNSQSDSSSHHF